MIRVEDLRIVQMTRSAKGTVEQPREANVGKSRTEPGHPRSSGWGMLVQRLEHKAAGRVEKIPAAYTSQTCSRCGTMGPGGAREPSRLPMPVLRAHSECRRERSNQHRGWTGRDRHVERLLYRSRRSVNLNSLPPRSRSWNPRPFGGEDVKFALCHPHPAPSQHRLAQRHQGRDCQHRPPTRATLRTVVLPISSPPMNAPAAMPRL